MAGRRLLAPGVTRPALEGAAVAEPRLRSWAARRLVPKVVVATQTAVVEAAVDDGGTWWPSVPVISVVCERVPDDTEHRWLVAAALLAPPVTAWALGRAGGTAMGSRSVKLSARQVAAVPLPVEEGPWSEAARLLADAAAAGATGPGRAARRGRAAHRGAPAPGGASQGGPALVDRAAPGPVLNVPRPVPHIHH